MGLICVCLVDGLISSVCWVWSFDGFDFIFFHMGLRFWFHYFDLLSWWVCWVWRRWIMGWSAVGRSIWSVAPVDGLIHLMTIDFFSHGVWFIWLWFRCFDLLFWWVCDPSSCSGFDRWRTRRMGLLGLCNESCSGFDRVLGSSCSVLVQWITVLIRSAVLVQWILLACVHRVWVLMKRCVSYFHSCISAHSCVSHLSVYFGYCVAWVPTNIKHKRETQRETWIQTAS